LDEPVCQYCGEPVTERVVLCRVCETPHHRECFEAGGGCTTYSCGSILCRDADGTRPGGAGNAVPVVIDETTAAVAPVERRRRPGDELDAWWKMAPSGRIQVMPVGRATRIVIHENTLTTKAAAVLAVFVAASCLAALFVDPGAAAVALALGAVGVAAWSLRRCRRTLTLTFGRDLLVVQDSMTPDERLEIPLSAVVGVGHGGMERSAAEALTIHGHGPPVLVGEGLAPHELAWLEREILALLRRYDSEGLPALQAPTEGGAT